MYSLNVPLPGEVASLASELARDIPSARARQRGTHTLVVKRLTGEGEAFPRLAARAREALAGTPAFEVRVAGLGAFEEAVTGPSPVVYLAVESPGLEALHRRLLEAFDPVDGMEGEAYVPHVTVARGGTLAAARRLAEREVEPLTWTVEELCFWDAEREQSVGSVSLPA